MDAGQLRWMIDYLRNPKGAFGTPWHPGGIVATVHGVTHTIAWLPSNTTVISAATVAKYWRVR